MAEDDRLKLSLNSIVKRRILTGNPWDKTCLVFKPTGESVSNIKELWGKVKNNKELYDQIMMDTALEGEKENDFDIRAFRILLSREFVEEVDDEGPNIEENNAVESSSEVRCKVTVRNFQKKAPVDDCESFLKQFNGVQMVKQEVFYKKKSSIEVFKGSYEVTFKDSDCAAKFVNLPVVKFGKQNLKKKLLYSCCHCSRSYVFKQKLSQHIARFHIKRSFQCHACPKKFGRQDHFENHKLLHDSSVPFCITCKKKFKSKLSLSKHLHYGSYCSLQCILCTKTFVKKCNLDKHMKVCHGDEDDLGGSCEICLKTFKYRIELERHRKCYTNIDGSFKFVCGYCEKKHCSFDMLGDHIRSDSEVCHSSRREKIFGNDVYPCEKCGKQFASKDLMMGHLETHTGNKARTKTQRNIDKPSDSHEFQCKLCGQKFTQYKNYDRHKRQAYDNDKNPRNLCAMCGKSFCTSRLLKRHLNLSHTVSCATCDESFTTKRALDHHIQKRESVTCVECKKIFCNKKVFRVHMSYAHHKYVKI